MSVVKDPGIPGVSKNNPNNNLNNKKPNYEYNEKSVLRKECDVVRMDDDDDNNMNNNGICDNTVYQNNNDFNNKNTGIGSISGNNIQPTQYTPAKYQIISHENIYKVNIQNIFINGQTSSPISLLKVGEKLNKIIPKETFCKLQKVNKNKIIASFNNMEIANNVADNPIFEKNGWKAFIPLFYISRAAIIKNVDTDYDIETLKKISIQNNLR